MLPHRRNEAHEEGDGLRAGFEVRVIGATPLAPVPEGGKDLEIGLQIGTGETLPSERVLMEQFHVKTDDYGKNAKIADVLKGACVERITDMVIMKVGA